MELTINPAESLRGKVAVPGDKSVSHRAVMFGALAEGITEIEGFLAGEDCLSTVSCLRKLGVRIDETGEGRLQVHGKGLHGLEEPGEALDVGNSGTTIRLMLGILAGQGFFSVLTGDQSIRRRPMARVTLPLAKMGAQILGRQEGNLAPLAVRGGNLQPIAYESPVASAQVKSAVLLAGLYAKGVTEVNEPYVSRDHTERMLRAFGAKVERAGTRVAVEGFPLLKAQRVKVPGDISSAAFFLVAGSIVRDGEIRLTNVGLNPTRDGILTVLAEMGASISRENLTEVSGEPVGDLIVRPAGLTGVKIGGSMIPRLIDEIPVLAVAAAYARGVTEIRDAAELKVKESNRIAAVARELVKLGVRVEELPDGLRIWGGKPLRGADMESSGDHRMAMAMAVAALGAQGTSRIRGAEAAAVSFPDFFAALRRLYP